jgi:hypothetical protein
MRDNFSKCFKEILAKRVQYLCSNPNCRKVTIGPHSIEGKTINLGVASHIVAASARGPRSNSEMTTDERKSISNGIWLCQNCAKAIDNDENKYTINELRRWKSLAEQESLAIISSTNETNVQNPTLRESRIRVYEGLFYELKQAGALLNELIKDDEMTPEEKKDAATYLTLQIAKFTDDNCFYMQEEIIAQCVGTFIGVADIFNSNNPTGTNEFLTYDENFRASYHLLKSVDSNGRIDTSKKTPLMTIFCNLLQDEEKKKNN